MILMMRKNWTKSRKERSKKRFLHFQESISRFERQLRMIKCYFKMKSSQLSLLKANSGQIRKLLVQLLLSLKALFIINAQHLQTLLVVKKDFLYNWLVKELVQRQLYLYLNGILETSLSILNILTKLQLKTREKSIAIINSFLMKLLLDQNSNFQRLKEC